MENDNKYRNTRLQKLSGSDFEIRDGDPDIKGWAVKDNMGRDIGDVDDLLFDSQSRKVRYLVLDLDFEELDMDIEDRKVLVPVGVATLHKEDDDVLLTGITIDQLKMLPEYDEDMFDLDTETNIRKVFQDPSSNTYSAPLANDSDIDDYYNQEYFNDTNLYRNRRGNI